jgi:hypothetical protein
VSFMGRYSVFGSDSRDAVETSASTLVRLRV